MTRRLVAAGAALAATVEILAARAYRKDRRNWRAARALAASDDT